MEAKVGQGNEMVTKRTMTIKRQHTADQPLRVPSDAPTRAPPPVFGGITIQEPTGGPRPTAQVEINMASSSRAEASW